MDWLVYFYLVRALAVEAEANIDAAQPPLFLQFVNLLINDAIYLLDEALSYMAQLRELQHQRLFQQTFSQFSLHKYSFSCF